MRNGDASGVIVPVPALDPIVQPMRRRADAPDTPALVAHVTVLFPWVTPPIEHDSIERLRVWARTVEPFDFVLESVEWFGDDVVWMRPEPSDRFKSMTTSMHELWPNHPPYGGDHPDPTPHLTIGEGGPLDAMRAVAETADALLPIHCVADSVWVMEGTLDPVEWWHTRTIPLGPA